MNSERTFPRSLRRTASARPWAVPTRPHGFRSGPRRSTGHLRLRRRLPLASRRFALRGGCLVGCSTSLADVRRRGDPRVTSSHFFFAAAGRKQAGVFNLKPIGVN